MIVTGVINALFLLGVTAAVRAVGDNCEVVARGVPPVCDSSVGLGGTSQMIAVGLIAVPWIVANIVMIILLVGEANRVAVLGVEAADQNVTVATVLARRLPKQVWLGVGLLALIMAGSTLVGSLRSNPDQVTQPAGTTTRTVVDGSRGIDSSGRPIPACFSLLAQPRTGSKEQGCVMANAAVYADIRPDTCDGEVAFTRIWTYEKWSWIESRWLVGEEEGSFCGPVPTTSGPPPTYDPSFAEHPAEAATAYNLVPREGQDCVEVLKEEVEESGGPGPDRLSEPMTCLEGGTILYSDDQTVPDGRWTWLRVWVPPEKTWGWVDSEEAA